MMKYKLNKNLGQHFLFDNDILKKIVNAIDHNDTQTIVEIGSGAGSLTRYLVNLPVNIISIEIDPKWAGEVSEKYSQYSNFKLINEDVMNLSWGDIALPGQKLIVVGNLPYQITSQILFGIIEKKELFSQCVFLIQKEVAERIAAREGSKKFGILSIAVQCFFSTEILFDVPPEAFTPPPKIFSSVIRLKEIAQEQELINDWKKFMDFIHMLFNQRRKMVKNRIKGYLPENNEIPANINHYLVKRPEQLSLHQLINLYKTLFPGG